MRAFPVLLLTGCIVLPVERGEHVPFTPTDFSFIEIGKTTREEVRTAMSALAEEPDDGDIRADLQPLEFREGASWLYSQTRAESRWLFLFWGNLAEPYLQEYANLDHWDISNTQDYHYVQIEFDDHDIVSAYSLSESEGRGCNEARVCARGPAAMLLGSEADDQSAKQFRAPEGLCGIYIYGKSMETSEKILFNRKPNGWLLDEDTYLFRTWPVGFVSVGAQNSYARLPLLSNFNCEGGESFFLEIRQKHKSRRTRIESQILVRDPEKGRLEVAKRKRLMNVSHFPN